MALLDDLTNAIAGFQRQLELRPPGVTATASQNGMQVRETRFEAQLPGTYDQEKDDSIQGRGSNSGGGGGDTPPYVPPPARPPPVCPTGGTRSVVFSGIGSCDNCLGGWKIDFPGGASATLSWNGSSWTGTASGSYTWTHYGAGPTGDIDCGGTVFSSSSGGLLAEVSCAVNDDGDVVYGAALFGDGMDHTGFGNVFFQSAEAAPLGAATSNSVNSDCSGADNPAFGGSATIS